MQIDIQLHVFTSTSTYHAHTHTSEIIYAFAHICMHTHARTDMLISFATGARCPERARVGMLGDGARPYLLRDTRRNLQQRRAQLLGGPPGCAGGHVSTCPGARGPNKAAAVLAKTPDRHGAISCPVPATAHRARRSTAPFRGMLRVVHSSPGPNWTPLRHLPGVSLPFASIMTPLPSCFPLHHSPLYLRPSGHVKVPSPWRKSLL